MAAALVQRARSSAPESVEQDLAALWREIADGNSLGRAVMSNLVIVRGSSAADDSTLEAVVANHPSRMIVVEHDQRPDHVSISADVGVTVFGTPATRYGVEKVIIRCACADASLTSIVRRYMRGDIPTSVWWTGDLLESGSLPAIVAVGRQLVFDSIGWRDVAAGVRALAPLVTEGRIDLADLNWHRLLPLRQALAHAAGSIGADVSATDIKISHRPGDVALAWLLASWLASRLEWTPGSEWPSITEVSGAEVLTLTVAAGTARLDLAMNDHRVRVDQYGIEPMVTAVPRGKHPEAIAAELRTLSRDVPFHQTLVALVERVVQS